VQGAEVKAFGEPRNFILPQFLIKNSTLGELSLCV